MTDSEDFYDKHQSRVTADKYWAAINAGDHQTAIYHLSPELHDKFLHIEILSPEERKDFENHTALLHLKLIGLISQASNSKMLKSSRYEALIDLVVWMLQKWFRFGEFRDVPTYLSHDRRNKEAELDQQQVEIIRQILDEDFLWEIPKTELAELVSRIKPGSQYGWAECQNIAQQTEPYNYKFQSQLQYWCNNMRSWYFHTSLGGMR